MSKKESRNRVERTIPTTTSEKDTRCFFTEKFERPIVKYKIVSFSIFYSPQYIRHYYKGDAKNISLRRQMQFLYNLTINIALLDHGYLPDDWYFRIFYDKSLEMFSFQGKKPWEEFFKRYRNHPKIQFVEYRCPDFFVDKSHHLGLFGTIMRLYPIFQKDDNLELICVFDADNFITYDYLQEIKRFERTKYDYNTFCSRFELSLYKREKEDSYCYLRTGMISTKVKLDPILWDFILYQAKEFSDKKFTNLLESLQEKWKMLVPDRDIDSYRNFEYGMDEIILNHYLRKMLESEGYKLRKVRYRPMTIAIFNTLALYLRYDYENTKNQAGIDKILQFYLKDEFKPGDIQANLDNLIELIKKNINFDSTYKDIEPYLQPIRDNMAFFETLWMSQTVKDYFREVNENDYEAKPFGDFFVSLDMPIYLQPARPHQIKKKRR